VINRRPVVQKDLERRTNAILRPDYQSIEERPIGQVKSYQLLEKSVKVADSDSKPNKGLEPELFVTIK
tara:strand:- start:489 stop:692 length:204 start_codon:yes stop_codon:yes gene_type:complete